MAACQEVLLTHPNSSHPRPLLSCRQSVPISPSAATLMDYAASIANKRLTEKLSPLNATLTKNWGGGPLLSTFSAHDSGADKTQNALPSAAQICPAHASEVCEHYRQRQQTQCNARRPAESHAAALRFRDVRLRHWRALRPRRYGYHQRAGTHAVLSPLHPIFLVRPRFARRRGADHRDSRRRRLLPLGPRGIRRLLGISGWMVELDSFVSSGRLVRRFDR